MNKRITVHVASKDRHSEVALLLQSLRTQTYQDFDVIILDDASGTPIQTSYFAVSLVNRLLLEGHAVKIVRRNHSTGVCSARNEIIKIDNYENPLIARIDDDVVLTPAYFEKLVQVIDSGYDLASGVVPPISHPEVFRDVSFVGEIINRHELDAEGNLVKNADDCGYRYNQEVILPTHQFRTNCLYKREVTDVGVRYPDFLTKVGFREEGFFSFRALLKGFKIGVHTGAVAFHMQCPSGGCRSNTYQQDVQQDDARFKSWVKEKFEERGNFL